MNYAPILRFQGTIEKKAFCFQNCLIQCKNSKSFGKTLAGNANPEEVFLIYFHYILRNKTIKFFDKAEDYPKEMAQFLKTEY